MPREVVVVAKFAAQMVKLKLLCVLRIIKCYSCVSLRFKAKILVSYKTAIVIANIRLIKIINRKFAITFFGLIKQRATIFFLFLQLAKRLLRVA